MRATAGRDPLARISRPAVGHGRAGRVPRQGRKHRINRQRRLTGVDGILLSLYAKGLTTGESSDHFAKIYGASVSRETVSRITDKVIEEMNDRTG